MFVLLLSIRAPRGEQPPWRKAACGPDTQHPPWDPRTGLPTGQGGVGVGASPASRGAGSGGCTVLGLAHASTLSQGLNSKSKSCSPGMPPSGRATAWSPGASLTDSPGQDLGGLERAPAQEGLGIPPGPRSPRRPAGTAMGVPSRPAPIVPAPTPSPSLPLPRTGPLLLQGHVTAESRLTAVCCYCLPVWRSGV